MFCRQCGTNNAQAIRFCTSCGAPLPEEPPHRAPPPAPPSAPSPGASAPPAPQAGSWQQPGFASQPADGQHGYARQPGGYRAPRPGGSISIDFRRLGIGDYVAMGASVLLFITLFLTWYSATGEDDAGNVITVSTSAVGQYSGGFRFLILVMAIMILLYLFVRTMTPRGLRLPLPHWQVLTALLGVQFLLTLLAFLLKPDAGGVGVSWEYGAYIGLVASVIAVGGGIFRRNEPEVIVPGAPRAGPSSYGHTPYAPLQPSAPQPAGPQPAHPQPMSPSGVPRECTQCGTQVPAGSPYCPSCGSPASS
jgi:zinc-ribbon domain